MGIASFVIGLSCLILSPFLSIFLILPSILALVLGIVDVVLKSKKKESKGLAIAGIVLSIIALLASIFIVVLGYYIYSSASNSIFDSVGILSNEINSEISADLVSDDITCKLGESATINDIKITLESVNKDFKDYYSFTSVKDGYTILKADFELENLGDYSASVYSSDFNCYADQLACDEFTFIRDTFYSTSINSGRRAKISICFEIPEDSDLIEIEFQPIEWYSSKVIFEID